MLDLLRANYTFLNERLAKHYGIPHVYGSRFRRVDARRRQLARRAAAPGQHPDGDVVRDADVAGDPRQVGPRQPARRAAAAAAAGRAGAEGQHRRRQPVGPRAAGRASHATRVCAACHNLMDPVGLSLEKFDAVGRWRTAEDGAPIDASGGLPDGSKFADVHGLEAALLRRPELFVGTLDREAADLRARARRRVLRRAGDPRDRPRRAGAGLPLLVDHPRNREEPAVSDEEVTMIITKKALPRRTFLRGMGATRGAAAARRDGPVDDRARQDAGRAGAPARLRLHADGLRPRRAGRRRAKARSTSCRRRSSRWRRSSSSSR